MSWKHALNDDKSKRQKLGSVAGAPTKVLATRDSNWMVLVEVL